MTRLPRTTCRNCRGSGATHYHDEAVLCATCLGTGRRFPDSGDIVYSGGEMPVGILQWQYERNLDGTETGMVMLGIDLIPGQERLLLPTIEEVNMAEREDAHPCQSE